jgi:transcriptional regulator with XRE-family HTH domain/tetratricopeptide (TPR) repeat protein
MARPEPNVQLREARKSKNLSRKDLAERLGVSSSTVGRWERGEAWPDAGMIAGLCQVLERTAGELGYGEDGGVGSAVRVTTRVTRAIYDGAVPELPAVPLVGRELDLEQVRESLLAGKNAALTALNGLPGVGKTTLAVALAHDELIHERFEDGILWAGLGPHANIGSMLSRWGTLLNIAGGRVREADSVEEWARALREAIGERKMLLVIDDAWSADEALACKVGGANCVHLVTTRFPGLAAQLSLERVFTLHELDAGQSMDLLSLLAPQVADIEQHRAQDLVQAVGGLPLALTLIGNYLRKQGYTGQQRRMQAALQRLNDARERLLISEPQAPAESHPGLAGRTTLSLQAIIAISDQMLNEQDSRALYSLSIFPSKPNSFAEEAALSVADCAGETLDRLNDAGLLESSGPGRYTLHQTIADYARMQLDKDNAHAAQEHLVVYIRDFTALHKKEYERLDQELAVIIVALDAARQLEKHGELTQIISALVPYLQARAQYALEERYLRHAYEVARIAGDTHCTINMLLYLSDAVHMQGDLAWADEYLQEGLGLARQIDDKDQISTLLTSLGWVAWKRGNLPQAEAYLREGLPLAWQMDQPGRICKILRVLAVLETSRGNYKKSEEYSREGLALAQQINDQELQFRFLSNLGVAAGEQGRFPQAIRYYLEGLKVARRLGHLEGVIMLLGNLGDVESELGNYAQAEVYLQEGLALARQIGHREWLAAVLANLGMMMRKRGKYEQARSYLQEGLSLARQVGRLEIACAALYDYGHVCLAEMQSGAAQASFEELLTSAPEDFQDFVALAQYGLARVAAAQGNFEEARLLGETSMEVLETIQHRDAGEVREWLEAMEQSGQGNHKGHYVSLKSESRTML